MWTVPMFMYICTNLEFCHTGEQYFR